MLQARYRYRFLPEGCFEHVDDSIVELTGHTADELYADPDMELKILHRMDRPLLQKFLHMGRWQRDANGAALGEKETAGSITVQHTVTAEKG